MSIKPVGQTHQVEEIEIFMHELEGYYRGIANSPKDLMIFQTLIFILKQLSWLIRNAK